MFNEKVFRETLEEKGKTLQDVANVLNINLSTLYRKMKGVSDFYRSEMDTIIKEFDIKDPESIFFAS